ncbi:MAG TPA: response regulator [Bdellovibrionota bacterium]|nr:response regulator [Bdellovibrionota bacterium]
MLLNSMGQPLTSAEDPSQGKDYRTSASAPRGSDIMIIDDEFLMRSLIEKYVRSAQILKGTEPKVHQRESGWDLLQQDLSNVRVAVVDILLPQVTGVDLIRDLRRRYPEMGIIAVTGMATEPMKRALLDLIPEPMLLHKPLRKEVFSQAFDKAWSEILPPVATDPPVPEEEDGEEYWSAASGDLRATEVPVVHRRIGRKKAVN